MMETSKQEQEAVIELRRVCDRLKISNDIFREALDFYKNWLSRAPKTKSLATEKSVMAGCLLVALKIHRKLISKDEIANAFNENVIGVALASHVICRAEGISESISSQFSAGKDNLKTAVDVIGMNLNLYGQTIADAEKLVIDAYNFGIKNEHWMYWDIAGASIFIAAKKNGEKITLEEVAKRSKTDSKFLLKKVNEIAKAIR